MRLNVLNVAYPFAPVGADAVGGAEQVVAQLDAGLTRAGHNSVVVACEDSEITGTLLPTPRRDTQCIDAPVREAAARAHRAAIARALSTWRIDLVHLHGLDFLDYLPPPGVPVLITLHLPIAWYPASAFQHQRPRTFLQCVSATQQRDCPPEARSLAPIENGVPGELFEGRHAKRSFALCLGRICPEKGFHLGLDAARQAGVPLLLAGKVFPYEAHQRYFESEIVPRLDRFRRFIGAVGSRRKRRLLSAAQCLLAPSLVPETSSLVAMEALACGTPVVAFPAGALANLVEPGKNGFLVSSTTEMALAIRSVAALSPKACRDSARTRFSQQRMVGEYLRLYTQLAEGAPGSFSAQTHARISKPIPDNRERLHAPPIGSTRA